MTTVAPPISTATTRLRRTVPRSAGRGSITDIARSLHLSEGTVRNYLSSAIGKTNARNRADAVTIAEENGWLPT